MEFESRQWNMKFFIKDAAEMDRSCFGISFYSKDSVLQKNLKIKTSSFLKIYKNFLLA